MLELRKAALFLAGLSVPPASSMATQAKMTLGVDTLLAEWDRDAEKFREKRKPYLLY